MNNQHNAAGEQLENAFELFNQYSEKLADSYNELELHVTQLTKELAEARNERLIQLAEKEVLANRLESLLDALPGGIVVVDADNCITQTNPVAREMLEMDNSSYDYTGSSWKIIAQQSILTIGDELRLRDGRWINISTCPVANEAEGKSRGKIILISDVTETRVLQNKLGRQQRLSSLGEMIASLAHQIRTPLSSALLYISTCNHPSHDENDRISIVEKAKDRLFHLERLVSDMLIFARGDVSASEYVNIHKFMLDVKSLLVPESNSEMLEIHIDDSLKKMTIQVNHDVLLSALQNIMNNAFESCRDNHAKDGINIVIRAFINSDGKFEISVQDNGCGMSDETKERILEPFYTTKSSGTGLGLAVVNATVNQYGGEMQIFSKHGTGSSFNIILPCTKVTRLLPGDISSNRNNKVNSSLLKTVQNQKTLNIVGKQEVAL